MGAELKAANQATISEQEFAGSGETATCLAESAHAWRTAPHACARECVGHPWLSARTASDSESSAQVAN